MVGKAMTKPDSKKSSVAAINATGKCATAASAAEQVKNGSVEPGCPTQIKASVMKQTSRECLHRRNTECEVYDDGTNTFFWWVLSANVNTTNVKYWTLQHLKWWCCFWAGTCKEILQIHSSCRKIHVFGENRVCYNVRFQGELKDRPKWPPLITSNTVTLFQIFKYTGI